MERKLHQEPVFDFETLRQNLDVWKARAAKKVTVEWSTGTGPTVFCYPLGDRKLGVKWTFAVETYNYNEIYADFIEFKLLPQIIEAIHARGLESVAICVDLQPLQVQRQRRRQIERAQSASALAHH